MKPSTVRIESAESLAAKDLEAVQQVHRAYQQLAEELAKVVVGQQQVIQEMLIAMLARGHCLLVGVPGLAKTLMIRTLAAALDLEFRRIQFTPDLMPADITGTEVLQEDRTTGQRVFRFVKGPIFGNVILADEINRTPPKTQAALLEAMQEHQVTVAGQRHPLPEPFFVLATQNPIEQEGTYPLPEAQLDRFMFHIWVDYPSAEEELEIVRRTTADLVVSIRPLLRAEQLTALCEVVRKVPVPLHVARYAMELARHTRRQEAAAPAFVREFVQWGAGPRASQYLVLGAKARAMLHGRCFVTPADVQAVAPPVLRHRLKLNFQAEAAGITADEVVRRLLAWLPLPGREPLPEGVPDVYRSADAG